MIYQETIIRKKLEQPIRFYGGIHHDIISVIDIIQVSLCRKSDGFYLIGNAYAHYMATDYSAYMNLNNLDIKIAPYHRMARWKIKQLMKDEKIKNKAEEIVQKLLERINEYKEVKE